jgi:pyridoxal phosphate enzyme (YggS family)
MPTATPEPARQNLDGSWKDRYTAVKARIAAAAKRSGRRPEDILLVAVTKHASIDQVREIVEMGHLDLGESRVQNLMQRAVQVEEFIERHRQLRGSRAGDTPDAVRWHMIGSLQRNKVRKIIGKVRLIHSVDSLRLAEEIQACATKLDDPVEVLVQVNASGEKSKHGVAPAAARHLVEQIDTMMHLRPRGLMCMAPIAEDPTESRQTFVMAHEVFEDIRSVGVGGERFDIISMGMSNDFEVAIECGSNMVRVGTGIFGKSLES